MMFYLSSTPLMNLVENPIWPDWVLLSGTLQYLYSQACKCLLEKEVADIWRCKVYSLQMSEGLS